MSEGKISILLPAYNSEPFIEEAIQSILNQEYDNFELLIADDFSTDSTKKIIDGFNDGRIKTFHNNKNIKKPSTCNKLLKYATGEFCTIHDADDTSHPKRFLKVIEKFRSSPEIAMCGHDIQRMTVDGKLLPLFRKKQTDYNKIIESMALDNTDGDASMVMRRDIIHEVGGLFRPYFKNNMDYDLALRIIEKYKTTNIQEPLLFYRNVPTSISKGITSFEKFITQDVTKFLAKERAEKGLDSLQREDFETIRELEETLSQPYLDDKTLYLRMVSSSHMYYKMYGSAIKHAFKATMEEPNKLVNWRTLQYCIRTTLINSISGE